MGAPSRNEGNLWHAAISLPGEDSAPRQHFWLLDWFRVLQLCHWSCEQCPRETPKHTLGSSRWIIQRWGDSSRWELGVLPLILLHSGSLKTFPTKKWRLILEALCRLKRAVNLSRVEKRKFLKYRLCISRKRDSWSLKQGKDNSCKPGWARRNTQEWCSVGLYFTLYSRKQGLQLTFTSVRSTFHY